MLWLDWIYCQVISYQNYDIIIKYNTPYKQEREKINKKRLIFITENILILLLVMRLSDTVLKIFRQDENCRHFSDIQI